MLFRSVSQSRYKGAKISSSREKGLDADENQIVKYSLETTYGEDQPEDEQGNELPNIDGNPFPLPTEITPTPVTPIPGSPTPVYEPTYPGLPYNPLDPLSREPNPYPAREDQPVIPYTPGDTNVPGSPISERPTYTGGGEEYGEILDQLPRADEISLEGLPATGGETEGGETEGGETEGGETEGDGEEEPNVPDELIPLLRMNFP